MPIVRTEYDFRRSTEVAHDEIDIADRDIVGRLTTDAEADACGAAEAPQFVFSDSADAGAPVSVIWFAGGGRMALRVNDTVLQGEKLTSDADGYIVASETAENAVPAAGDFAIAQDNGTAGQFVECVIL